MIRAILSRLLAAFLETPVHDGRSAEELARDDAIQADRSRLLLVEGPPKRIVAQFVTAAGRVTPIVFSTQGAHRLSDDLMRSVAILEQERADKGAA